MTIPLVAKMDRQAKPMFDLTVDSMEKMLKAFAFFKIIKGFAQVHILVDLKENCQTFLSYHSYELNQNCQMTLRRTTTRASETKKRMAKMTKRSRAGKDQSAETAVVSLPVLANPSCV